MEALTDLLLPVTAWHWLVIGLLLIGVEMLVGTFDLLWIGVAALATALYASGIVPVPEAWRGWEQQALLFFILAIVLVALGRTAFSGLRNPSTTHPTLNQRDRSMVGARGTVESDFVSGEGRVKIGDTTWMARAEDGGVLTAGAGIEVTRADGTLVFVKAI